ncbi:MAG: polysaccharide pyruvyl transferase family protein, partial [Sphingomicrobium sp.]
TTPTAYRFNKVRDLTAAVGAERHMLAEDAAEGTLDELLGQPLDAAIGGRISQLRSCSDEYLNAALQ